VQKTRGRGQAWDYLRSLIAIAKQGSISAAARAMSVEHPTISRHIAALDERIGSKLFERTPSGTRRSKSSAFAFFRIF
jgi:molybdate transport repressor ModE-like protein